MTRHSARFAALFFLFSVPLMPVSPVVADTELPRVPYTPGAWSQHYSGRGLNVQALVNEGAYLVRRRGWACDHVIQVMPRARGGYIFFCAGRTGRSYIYDIYDRGGRWAVDLK